MTETIEETKSPPNPLSNSVLDSRGNTQEIRQENENAHLMLLQEIQKQQTSIEKRIFERIQKFKSNETNGLEEFLSKLEFVFDLFHWNVVTRIEKTKEKFDESLHPHFTLLNEREKMS